MAFVQAKCPNCGGFLAVDNANDAAICQFCGTPFIVENAVQNYNITVKGDINLDNATVKVEGAPNISSLLLRASSFIKEKDYSMALEYYNKVLDLDPYNRSARAGISNLTIPKKENLLVKVERVLVGGFGRVSIIVDGDEIGLVPYGRTFYCKIALGWHTIEFTKTKREPIDFFLPSALQYVRFVLTPGMFYWDIENGIYDFPRNLN